MKIFKRLAIFLLASILIFTFNSCSPKGSVLTFAAFNTVIRIETHGTVVSATTKNELKNLFSRLENSFDKDVDGSLVKRFNDLSFSGVINLNDEEFTVLNAAKICYDFSDGKFDPTVYPLTELWGFSPYAYSPNFISPSQDQIDEKKALCDFSKIIISEQAKTLTKTHADVKLDLGGMVKGYAADAAAKILTEAGHFAGYVSVGGSSLNLLKSQSLGLIHPRKEQNILTVNTQNYLNLSVSTSGDYERYHLGEDGKRFSHIIDPDSGYPADTGVMSATLLGIDGAIGDGLTTALCLKSFDGENGSELVLFINRILAEYPQTAIFITYQSGTQKLIITNQTQGTDFTLHDQAFEIYKI